MAYIFLPVNCIERLFHGAIHPFLLLSRVCDGLRLNLGQSYSEDECPHS